MASSCAIRLVCAANCCSALLKIQNLLEQAQPVTVEVAARDEEASIDLVCQSVDSRVGNATVTVQGQALCRRSLQAVQSAEAVAINVPVFQSIYFNMLPININVKS